MGDDISHPVARESPAQQVWASLQEDRVIRRDGVITHAHGKKGLLKNLGEGTNLFKAAANLDMSAVHYDVQTCVEEKPWSVILIEKNNCVLFEHVA